MAEYEVLKQVHINQMDSRTGHIESGFEISVHDLVSGAAFNVFLADDRYSAENARTLILDKLQHVRAVHDLSE